MPWYSKIRIGEIGHAQSARNWSRFQSFDFIGKSTFLTAHFFPKQVTIGKQYALTFHVLQYYVVELGLFELKKYSTCVSRMQAKVKLQRVQCIYKLQRTL